MYNQPLPASHRHGQEDQTMKVELLAEYSLEKDTVLLFQNGYKLELKSGIYWVCAFGVVLDCINHECIACPEAEWKLS